MARLVGGSIRKTISKKGGETWESWGFSIMVDGRQVRRQGFLSRAEAQDALDAFKEEQKNAPAEPAPVVTFKQAVERYVQAKAWKKSLAHDRLYLRQLQAVFGADTPLTEITAAEVAAWRDAQLSTVCERTGKPYAPASVNRPLAALRTLMTLAAEEWGWLDEAPRIRLAKEPEGRIRWLEPDEETRLLAAARESKNSELVPALVVAMETGLRRGEQLGLTWADVDLTRGVIRLEVTKSGKRREVPMRDVVYGALSELPGDRTGLVFKTRSLRTAFERAVVRAGIQDLKWHDLRHHFASWFVMRGGSIQALKELLGHADLKMTLRYAHLAPDHLREQVTRTARGGDVVMVQDAVETPVGK